MCDAYLSILVSGCLETFLRRDTMTRLLLVLATSLLLLTACQNRDDAQTAAPSTSSSGTASGGTGNVNSTANGNGTGAAGVSANDSATGSTSDTDGLAGTVNDAAEGAETTAENAVEATGDALQNAGDAVSDAANNAADAASDAAQNAGEALNNAAENTEQAASNAAENAGDAVSGAADDVQDAAATATDTDTQTSGDSVDLDTGAQTTAQGTANQGTSVDDSVNQPGEVAVGSAATTLEDARQEATRAIQDVISNVSNATEAERETLVANLENARNNLQTFYQDDTSIPEGEWQVLEGNFNQAIESVRNGASDVATSLENLLAQVQGQGATQTQ